MRKLNENTKVTLTFGQLRRIVKESNEESDCVFGIPGLEISEYNSYWGNPTYLKFNGKEYHVRDLSFKISHGTINRPLNDDWGCSTDWRMLCKAKSKDNDLFIKTLSSILNGKEISAWWDDMSKKWEKNRNVLRKKNRDREERERERDMMNGL